MPITTEPPPTADGEHTFAFGSFRLLAAQRLLLEGDRPVRLGSRAFDILTALVERAGEVIGKDELMARVWPQTFVEEANLKIQVSGLRRALGDGQGGHRFVVTVPGRGYNFVAPVSREETSQASPSPSIAPAGLHNLPAVVTRMIGRDEAEAAIMSRLSRQRLVTVVGPGGVGKTTVVLAVAEQMTADYQHGVWLIDLAPLGDPRLVPSTVATVLGLEIRAEHPLPGLLADLIDKRMLLLLDNCEHVIDGAASLAAAVLSGVPGVNILVTSREPLGVVGEHEYRLGPLSGPQRSSELSAAEAATFPAVQLFVQRVSAVVEDFALNDANAPLVCEICRRLDGLPLAIEFAAPRVEVLGVEGLAAHLHDSLPGLGARRRAALPRHRTMRAVLDWSYGLLSEDEQQLFRALGIFAGGFTVEATAAVATDASAMRVDAIDRLADLVAKSLVVADVSGTSPRFRLLDTTRAYAIEKLDAGGERERIACRQANARLIEVATSLNAQRWQTVGRFLEGKLMVERRDFAKGLAALRDAFEACGQTGWLLSYPEYKCWLAEALAGLGQLDEALDAVREGLEGSGQGEESQRWYVPELLRIKGEVLLQQAVDRSVSLAEDCFAQAGEVAREQGALFWELRVALSVARLRMTQGRDNEARQVLAPVYERFTEGFGTADMLSARQLLEALS